MDPVNQLIEDRVLTPLRQARQSLSDADSAYQASLQKFLTNVDQLFRGSSAFSGAGADTVAQLVQQYMERETSQRPNSVQEQLPALYNLCESTASHLQQEIDWYYSLPWVGDLFHGGGQAQAGAVVMGSNSLIDALAAALDLGVVATVGLYAALVLAGYGEFDAQNKVEELSQLVIPKLQNLNGSIDGLTAASVLALPPSALAPGGLNNGSMDLPGLALLAAAAITLDFARSKGKIIFNNPDPDKGQQAAIDLLAKELGLGSSVERGWIQYLITLMGAAGIPLDQAMDIVRCLNARGWMQPTTTGAPWDPAYATVWNIVNDQLEPDDIQAAWDDIRGIPVVDPTGKVWKSHLDKVFNGIKGLRDMLNNPKLSKGFKDAIRKLIKWVEDKIVSDDNPLTWSDQGRSNFWLDVAKNSGCLQKNTGKTNWP